MSKDKDIQPGGVEAANAAASALFSDLNGLLAGFDATRPEEWTNKLDSIIQFAGQLQRHMRTALFVAVRIMQLHWHELPLEFRQKYGGDFQIYLALVTDIEPSTYDNYARAIDTFVLSDDVRPVDRIVVPVRDAKGKPVVDSDGAVQTVEVTWNPLQTDISKLNLMASRARKEGLKQSDWALLADPKASVEAVKTHLYKKTDPPQNGHNSNSPPPPIRRWISLDGPMVVVHFGDVSVPVAEVDWALWEDSETQPLLQFALERLGIRLDEDRTAAEYRATNSPLSLAPPEF